MKDLWMTLILLTLTFGCGKEAEQQEITNQENSSAQGIVDIKMFPLQDFRRAIEFNRVSQAKLILKENQRIDLDEIQIDGKMNGETYLTYAIKSDFHELRDFLINKSALLEQRNALRETPLIAAAATGKMSSVRILTDRIVDLEKRRANGDTALLAAIKASEDDIAVLLIKYGANIQAQDQFQKNAFSLAQEKKLKKTIALLDSIMRMESSAPDISGFRHLVQTADYNALAALMNRYPNLAAEEAYNDLNPLGLLVNSPAEEDAIKSAQILLENKAKVNGPKDAESSPLIIATLGEKKRFVSFLLAWGADVQSNDRSGKSALIYAVEKNNLELVKLLLSHRAVREYNWPSESGSVIKFSACMTAARVQMELPPGKDLKNNAQIRKALRCGILGRLF